MEVLEPDQGQWPGRGHWLFKALLMPYWCLTSDLSRQANWRGLGRSGTCLLLFKPKGYRRGLVKPTGESLSDRRSGSPSKRLCLLQGPSWAVCEAQTTCPSSWGAPDLQGSPNSPGDGTGVWKGEGQPGGKGGGTGVCRLGNGQDDTGAALEDTVRGSWPRIPVRIGGWVSSTSASDRSPKKERQRPQVRTAQVRTLDGCLARILPLPPVSCVTSGDE